ncbi:extensin-like domain-containing protein [Aureimonas psammosilenae]|uniref:extensin-like domain-containing protein n=1 Tax=Aureimonas psammosilenae TaxID=2495496 RepID=UPI0012603FFC|nr:extensin family protein [Aureimonas psammosilenae]
MSFRVGGLPMIVSVAACVAATGAMVASAKDVDKSILTGSTAKYVWGGSVPDLPKPGEKVVYIPSIGLNGEKPVPMVQDFVQAPYVAGIEPPKPHAPVIVAPGEEIEEGEGRETAGEVDEPPVPAAKPDSKMAKAEPPSLPKARDVGKREAVAAYAPPREAEEDPWEGLKTVTPGLTPRKKASTRDLPSYASLEPMPSARSRVDSNNLPGRGALEDETPTGYQSMPKGEAMCRAALKKLGVRFVDMASISRGRSCGIDFPVKVTEISPGVAMKPVGVLNCMTALRVSQWVSNEVKPAAQSNLSKKPVALFNASSYRCSRIAGTRTVSEHASGNAIDVAGFQLADGSNFDVRKKGAFAFGEKNFQAKVRQSACRYFGTVLGPGYNRDHADHLHLDLKQRRRGVCK